MLDCRRLGLRDAKEKRPAEITDFCDFCVTDPVSDPKQLPRLFAENFWLWERRALAVSGSKGERLPDAVGLARAEGRRDAAGADPADKVDASDVRQDRTLCRPDGCLSVPGEKQPPCSKPT